MQISHKVRIIGMKNGKRFVSIKLKILLPTIFIVILTLTAVLLIVLISSTQRTNILSNDYMYESNEHYANIIEGNLNAALSGIRSLKPVFEQNKLRAQTVRENDIELLNRFSPRTRTSLASIRCGSRMLTTVWIRNTEGRTAMMIPAGLFPMSTAVLRGSPSLRWQAMRRRARATITSSRKKRWRRPSSIPSCIL